MLQGISFSPLVRVFASVIPCVGVDCFTGKLLLFRRQIVQMMLWTRELCSYHCRRPTCRYGYSSNVFICVGSKWPLKQRSSRSAPQTQVCFPECHPSVWMQETMALPHTSYLTASEHGLFNIYDIIYPI